MDHNSERRKLLGFFRTLSIEVYIMHLYGYACDLLILSGFEIDNWTAK